MNLQELLTSKHYWLCQTSFLVARYYGFTVCPSICHTSVHTYFHFWTITSVNVNGFSPNLICALILWRSGLGLLMAIFRQFLTELSAHNMSDFLFPDDSLSKYQWIFTKLGLCIDVVEIWFVH